MELIYNFIDPVSGDLKRFVYEPNTRNLYETLADIIDNEIDTPRVIGEARCKHIKSFAEWLDNHDGAGDFIDEYEEELMEKFANEAYDAFLDFYKE